MRVSSASTSQKTATARGSERAREGKEAKELTWTNDGGTDSKCCLLPIDDEAVLQRLRGRGAVSGVRGSEAFKEILLR